MLIMLNHQLVPILVSSRYLVGYDSGLQGEVHGIQFFGKTNRIHLGFAKVGTSLPQPPQISLP
jgi:hypothetical protein